MELRIAHLSDIHFRSEINLIGISADDNMREDVVRELIKLTKEFGKLDALLISGDIAFSGKVDEFTIARKWLYSILERTESRHAKIIVCPGNHDIDQDVLNDAIIDMHDKVRTEKNIDKRQQLLFSRLKDERSRNLLLASLENYNQFAVEFGCEFYPNQDRHSWTHDLSLNDGSKLRIRGLNSTILSGKKDDKKTLFLGRNSWSLRKEDGVEYLVFAHHPPSWLYDEVEMNNELDDKARLQMYGHEHSARVVVGTDSVRLFAGAINPERDHASWVPGFNFLRLNVGTKENVRTLNVIIHSMQWQNTAPSQFVMYQGKHIDGTHRCSFPLSDWTPIGPQVLERVSADTTLKPFTDEVKIMPEPPTSRICEQDFVRRFFDLDFVTQKKILDELGLMEGKESTLPQFMQIKNSLKRAKEKNLLCEITNKINSRI